MDSPAKPRPMPGIGAEDDRSAVTRAGAQPSLDRSKAFVWSALGIAIGAILLYAALTKVDMPSLVSAMGSANYLFGAAILGATAAFVILKAWRWRLLLMVPSATFRHLHSAVYVGLAVNFLIAHVGEAIRATWITRRCAVPFGTVISTIFVERMLDFLALLALLAGYAAVATNLPEIVYAAAAVVSAALVAAVAVLYLMLRTPRWLAQASGRLLDRLPEKLRRRLSEQLERVRAGMSVFGSRRLMVLVVVGSVAQWVFIVAAIWFSGLAVGSTVTLSGAMVTLLLLVLGLSIPNSPMQIGTTQVAFVMGFGLDGTPAATAVAASVVYTAFLIIPVMLAGSGLFIKGKFHG